MCGGRLGVVHYTVLHTYPPSISGSMDDVLDVDIDEEYFEEQDIGDGELPDAEELESPSPVHDDEDEDEEDDASDQEEEDDDDDAENDNDELNFSENDSCAPLSLPVFDVARNTPPLQFIASPHSSMPSTFSEDSLGQTVQQLVRTNSNNNNNTAASTESNSEPIPTTEPGKVIVFSGYCKWRTGQLEREIQREVWDVCVDATPDDILRDHTSGFWEEISQSNRLLSWQGLLEEGEG